LKDYARIEPEVWEKPESGFSYLGMDPVVEILECVPI